MNAEHVSTVAIVGDVAGAVAVVAYYASRVRKWWTYPEGILVVLLFGVLATGILPVALEIALSINAPWFAWLRASLFIVTFVLLVSILIIMHRRLSPVGAHARRS